MRTGGGTLPCGLLAGLAAPAPGQKELAGADPAGHPDLMPPAVPAGLAIDTATHGTRSAGGPDPGTAVAAPRRRRPVGEQLARGVRSAARGAAAPPRQAFTAVKPRAGRPGLAGDMAGSVPRVLHVVVGHGLPAYFLNAVRSVRSAAPGDPVLVIDNASPDPALRAALRKLADQDPAISVILRPANELHRNSKTGGLYAAYELAFAYAISRKFDLLHLIQGDFQVMWWDGELVRKSWAIFGARARCVNIHTVFLSCDKELTDDLVTTDSGLISLRDYGLTDSGLYHLGRWQARGMRFDTHERAHASRYLREGLEVICHPWPADAQIPWPAVIRNGMQRGREVATGKPFILKPLSAADIAALKRRPDRACIEDMCIPWGWVSATPMWLAGLDSVDYWKLRYRDARRNGLGRLLPRPDLRGIEPGDRYAVMRRRLYRPPLSDLLAGAAAREIMRRLRGG